MEHCDSATPFDAAFSQVPGLKWLPWVGDNFEQRPLARRLLVVGESHYFLSEDSSNPDGSSKQHLDPQFTRRIVSAGLVNREWHNNTLDTIPKLLFGTDEVDHAKVWADCGFYNFIQRAMDYKGKGLPERPSRDEFLSGWRVFVEVVKILQPSHCLFIGVEASNSFNEAMVSLGMPKNRASLCEKIGGTRARVAKLDCSEGTTELIFVKHLAKFFPWTLWHSYLQRKHEDLMAWLNTEAYGLPESSGMKRKGLGVRHGSGGKAKLDKSL